MISTGCDMDYRQSSRAVHVGRYRQGSSTVMAGGFVACYGDSRGTTGGSKAKHTAFIPRGGAWANRLAGV